MKMPGWQIDETRGKPSLILGRQITPVGRAVQVSWSGGGVIWHRPVAVEVRQGDATRRLPIQNVTRRAIIGIALAGLLLATQVAIAPISFTG